MIDWRPIETVSKTQDKPVLLLLESGGAQVCSWEENSLPPCWIQWLGGAYYGLPLGAGDPPVKWASLDA